MHTSGGLVLVGGSIDLNVILPVVAVAVVRRVRGLLLVVVMVLLLLLRMTHERLRRW